MCLACKKKKKWIFYIQSGNDSTGLEITDKVFQIKKTDYKD